MERELNRELSPGHPLFGLPVETLARRHDCDDVLFALTDGTEFRTPVAREPTPCPGRA